MCRDYNGYHSDGSSFVYVNDSWLLQKLFVYHRYKLNSKKKKKKKKKSQYMVSHPKPVRIRQSGRTGIGGVTPNKPSWINNYTNFNLMQLSNPVLSTVDLCTIIGLSTHDACTSCVHLPNYVSIQH